jgi:vitamin B12 transporter
MWILLFIQICFAQEILPPIEVSTSTLEQFSSESLWIIDDVQSSPSLAKSLFVVPGVDLIQNGAEGGTTSFFIRGTEARHTLFLWNGVRLNDPSMTERQFDGSNIKPFMIQKMLVKKQPEPVLYGGDALGGVVQLIPQFKLNHAAELEVGVGSFDSMKLQAVAGWKNGVVGVNRFKSYGISRLNKKRFHAKEADGVERNQINSHSKHHWNKLELELGLQVFEIKAEQDLSTRDTSRDTSRSTQILVSPKLSRVYKHGKINFHPSLAASRRRYVTTHYESQNFSGLNFQNELNFETKNSITGFNWWREEYRESTLKKTNDLVSVFSKQQWRKDKWSFNPGVRLDQHQRYHGFFTGEMGINYQLNHGKLFSKISQGYKPPTLYQLYAPVSFGSPVGNRDLTPEKGLYSEVGVEWKKKLSWTFSLFQHELHDLVQYTTTDGYKNGGSLMIQGVESGVGVPLFDHHSLHLSSTIQNFRHEEAAVLRRPNYATKATWQAFWSDLFTSQLSARWVGARLDRYSEETVKLNPYQVFDLNLVWEWSKDSLMVNVNNLMDQEYEDVYGYSVTPLSGDITWNRKF